MAGLGRLARFACLAPAWCSVFYAGAAFAQATASEKAAAEALFDQGLRLMKQSNFAQACPKLEESNRIDPAVGTLLYLGECFERVGRTASAWATFREAASLANNSNQAERARIAAGRAQELEPKLSKLSVELAPEVSAIPGVVVKRGGQSLDGSLYGTPLPVDPGEYRVEVSAPGYEVWTTSIDVAAGGASASVRVPALVKSATPAAPPPDAEGSETPSGVAGERSAGVSMTAPPGSFTTQQTLGVVVGGVGLVGIGLGSYFGIRAISKNSKAEEDCPNGLCQSQDGLDLTDEAKQQAQFSNIAFAAGGVLLATGAVLFLTGGSSDADRVALVPLLAPNLAAASVTGRF
jgi:tetratricopeptide (TPR) repeat protein